MCRPGYIPKPRPISNGKDEIIFSRDPEKPIDMSYPYELWSVVAIPLQEKFNVKMKYKSADPNRVETYQKAQYEKLVRKAAQCQKTADQKIANRVNSVTMIGKSETHAYVELHLYFCDWVKQMYKAHLISLYFSTYGEFIMGRSGMAPLSLPDPLLHIPDLTRCTLDLGNPTDIGTYV